MFPIVAIAGLISAFFGGGVSISRSLSASWMSAGCCAFGLFSVSLKCSVQLCSCLSVLVSSLPSLSLDKPMISLPTYHMGSFVLPWMAMLLNHV